MANYILHPASSRGFVDHGWLKACHSFSFASWHNPDRIHFGALRVLNDDLIAPGKGFGMHPHDNMEIITIPLSGELKHQDSLGNEGIIRAGDVQVMSAGSGVIHSEFNPSPDKEVSLFQIWIFPKFKNVKPRYAQQSFNEYERINNLLTIVEPGPIEEGLWIYQEAWLSIGKFDNHFSAEYKIHKKGNGVYAMVVNGSFEIENHLLLRRDAIGISDTEKFSFTSKEEGSEILVIEVPVNR
jgi:redox-sensitive bicupin YhaK (pirin superfamily)